VVSQVDLTVDPTQTIPIIVQPTIGLQSDAGNLTSSQMKQLVKRVKKLERLLAANITDL
jgi:hypothetical protein